MVSCWKMSMQRYGNNLRWMPCLPVAMDSFCYFVVALHPPCAGSRIFSWTTCGWEWSPRHSDKTVTRGWPIDFLEESFRHVPYLSIVLSIVAPAASCSYIHWLSQCSNGPLNICTWNCAKTVQQIASHTEHVPGVPWPWIYIFLIDTWEKWCALRTATWSYWSHVEMWWSTSWFSCK